MTHFDVIVCRPPTAPGGVRGAISAAMAPYDAGTGREPDEPGMGEWDRWDIQGEFLVRPPFDDDPAIIRAAVWPSGKPRVHEPLQCDGGPVRMLDIAAMRAAARERGRREWEAWSRLLARYPKARTLEELRAEHGAGAWRVFTAQPLVRAAREEPPESPLGLAPFEGDPVSYFGDDEEAFLDDAAAGAINGWAVVTLDGAWHDYEKFPGTTPEFTRWQARYLDGLPGEAIVVQLYCHI